MLNPFNRHRLRRYKDILWLMLKYGRTDLVRRRGDEARDCDLVDLDDPRLPAELARDLERLGPTFVKLGQLLSAQLHLLPRPYVDALARLQDAVQPFPFEEVRRIVEDELGQPLTEAFQRFDPVPIAAASLGQVHRARLDTTREVVVKVQRPRIREQIVRDFDALQQVARMLDRRSGERYGLCDLLDRSRRTVLAELDYRAEADNLATIGRNLAPFPALIVPKPVPRCTTSHVLVMDYVAGEKVTALTPERRREVDGQALVLELFRAYLQQILVDGLFHADPHPGNVLLTPDGRLALVDLGMVGRVSPHLREQLLQLVIATSEGRGDLVAAVAIDMGSRRRGFDRIAFTQAVSDIVLARHGAALDRLQLGATVLEVARTCGEHLLRVPDQLAVIGKTLMSLDQVARALAPDFAPEEVMRDYALSAARQQVTEEATALHMVERALEVKHLAERLPNQLTDLLGLATDGELSVRVDAIDEARLIRGIQKVANRITLGLVLAAAIVGAALLMQVRTDFTLLGYPGLAIILFLCAFLGGLAVVGDILLRDE